MRFLSAYLATLLAFIVADSIWISAFARDFYRARIGHLLSSNPSFPAAAAVYLIYAAGVLIFAVTPALETNDWLRAAVFGSAFGFFTYALYDLTCHATLKDWPLSVALADMVWGTFVTALAAAVGYAAASLF